MQRNLARHMQVNSIDVGPDSCQRLHPLHHFGSNHPTGNKPRLLSNNGLYWRRQIGPCKNLSHRPCNAICHCLDPTFLVVSDVISLFRVDMLLTLALTPSPLFEVFPSNQLTVRKEVPLPVYPFFPSRDRAFPEVTPVKKEGAVTVRQTHLYVICCWSSYIYAGKPAMIRGTSVLLNASAAVALLWYDRAVQSS